MSSAVAFVSGGSTLTLEGLLEMRRELREKYPATPDPLDRVVRIRCHRDWYDRLRELARGYCAANPARPGIQVEVAPLMVSGIAAVGLSAKGEFVLVIRAD